MKIPCVGVMCVRPPLEIADELRGQVLGLTAHKYADPDRFDGLEIDGWIVAYARPDDIARETAARGRGPRIKPDPDGGMFLGACPDCRSTLLPNYGGHDLVVVLRVTRPS